MAATIEGPVTIAEEQLSEPEFNHKHARVRIVSARCVQKEDPVTEHLEEGDPDKRYLNSFPLDLVIEPNQSEHPELERAPFVAFKITYWLRAYGEARDVRAYKDFCAAFGLEPLRIDISKVVGMSAIASLQTNEGKGQNAGRVFHNVNQITPA